MSKYEVSFQVEFPSGCSEVDVLGWVRGSFGSAPIPGTIKVSPISAKPTVPEGAVLITKPACPVCGGQLYSYEEGDGPDYCPDCDAKHAEKADVHD